VKSEYHDKSDEDLTNVMIENQEAVEDHHPEDSAELHSEKHTTDENTHGNTVEMSEDEDNPEVQKKYRHQLLQWVVDADFSQEFSLQRITEHKFRVDYDEAAELKSFDHVAKLMKVLVYKIGLSYKRQELFREELLQKISESQKTSLEQVQ